LLLAVAVLTAASASPLLAAHQQIDTGRSSITVRVFKAGLFRGFGDNHEIHGAVQRGILSDRNPVDVHISVDARNLRVVDPGASTNDRAQIQARMLGPDVLDASRFPEIRFDSDAAETNESAAWTVHGQLTLHGQTRPLTVHVHRDQGHYKGSVTLKQTDFGMTPISVAGGAVKVKDELTIEFDIVTQASPSLSTTSCAPCGCLLRGTFAEQRRPVLDDRQRPADTDGGIFDARNFWPSGVGTYCPEVWMTRRRGSRSGRPRSRR
jgi:polyisoprenoid-binding protein YceI